MLKDVQKKYSEIFENHFKEVFQGSLDVKCSWGFPVIDLTLTSKNEAEGITSIWSFSINVSDEKYNLASKSFKVEEEKEISQASIISGEMIGFVVRRTIEIGSSFFQEPKKEEAVESAN